MGYLNQQPADQSSTHTNGVLASNGHARKLHQSAVKSQLMVTSGETVVIHPTCEKPTPKGFYMLSNLDQTFPYPIEIVFKYEMKNDDGNNSFDVVDVLKKSLGKVLEEFYPLAGGMDVTWDGRMLVDCGGGHGGVPFVEAFCDEDMSSSIGDITKVDDKLAQLVYSGDKPYETILDAPPFSVQVTKFRCGGIILGVGFNHVLVDGRAFADLMLCWSEVARGMSISAYPYLDRSIFSAQNPPKIQKSHPEYSKSKSPLIPLLSKKVEQQTILNKSFTFTPSKMTQLKKTAMQNDNQNIIPTSFELISAVIWISWTKATQVNPQKTTQIITAVDGRPKFLPPLPKPYFGNGIVWSCARSKASDLTREPFSYAVQIVHEAIKEVTEEYVRSAIDYHEVKRKPLEQENTLWITKWSRLPFYEVEFPWGKPSQVAPASLVDNLAVTLSEGKDSENLVVSISLPAEAMEVFQEGMEAEWK